MLNEYLASDGDEHQASDEFGTGFEVGSYGLAKIYADNGEEHSGETDNGNRAPYGYLKEGKGNTNGKGIDTGGYGKCEHMPESPSTGYFVFILGKGFLNHIGTNDSEQEPCHPMVPLTYECGKAKSEEIAYAGH